LSLFVRLIDGFLRLIIKVNHLLCLVDTKDVMIVRDALKTEREKVLKSTDGEKEYLKP